MDQINDMFSQIRANTEWDLSGPMVWGYFFTDTERETLTKLDTVLADQGYRHVGVHHDGVWWLHVERIETHSEASLNQRNLSLYKLAEENGVDCYDGMDVGPPPAKS